MHSRILGICTVEEYKEFVNNEGEEPKLPIGDYEDQLPYFADYVNEDTDLDDDFEYFVEGILQITDKIEVNKDARIIIFKEGFKQEYFKDKWQKIRELSENFEDFCNGRSTYLLEKAVNEKYGYYQANIFGNYQTEDDFLKEVEIGKEYILFDSIDYHL